MARVDVVVIGAGAAGLAAARALVDAGRTVAILEARDRLGGRIATVRAGDLAIELGAEFVHGDAPSTRAWLARGRVRTERVRAARHEAAADGPRRAGRHWRHLGRVLGALDPGLVDRDVASALAAVDAPADDLAFARRYLEGFHAVDPEHASVRAILEEEGDDAGGDAQRSARIPAGQDRLVALLAAGLEVRTRTAVVRVRHRADGVDVEARGPLGDAVAFEAAYAVVAVPIGVLQADAIAFDPPLPGWIGSVRPGAAVRVTLRFDAPFWKTAVPRLGYLFGAGRFPTFWTAAAGAPAVTAWCGGPSARAMAPLSPEDRAALAVDDFAAALGLPPAEVRARLRGWYHHDWVADPLARGAYSYVATDGLAGRRHFAEPFGRLSFAGEHVPVEGAVASTVEAALRSGERAAARILA
jgi:monoamine oxidase